MRSTAGSVAASVALLCAGGWFQPNPAGAQISASDKAAAEALFDRGLALMREGKFEEACPKLEQSQAIERGIGTMLYLGECYAKLGRTASAWALFREASSAARAQGESERAHAGAARADQLEAKLSKVTLQVAPENAVTGFELVRDGMPMPSGLWGMPVPVDPGEHKFVARAPGRAAWSTTVNVAPDGANVEIAVPPLALESAATAPTDPIPATPAAPPPVATAPGPVAPPAAAPAPQATPASAASSTLSTQQIAGIAIGGAGVIALGFGTYFGLHAASKNSDAEKHCSGSTCDQTGITLTHSAQHAARLANVFVFSGAALAIAGGVLFLTAPRASERVAVTVVSDGRGAGLSLGGTF